MPLLDRLQGRWKRLGLQARLNLQLAFITVTLFAVLLAIVLMIQRATVRRVSQENGFSLVRVFAFSSVQGVIDDDFLALRELGRSLARQPEVRYAMVLDLSGRAIMHSRVQYTNRVFSDPLTLEVLKVTEPVVRETLSDTGEHIDDFAAPVFVLNERRAVARIGISFEHELRLLQFTRNTILGLAMLTLIGGLFWVHLHVRRLSRPIQTLQAGAARIGAGALDQRIEVRTGDEFEVLAEQFNSMAAQLQESYANLEQKVEARTRELTEALGQLQALGEVSRAVSSTLNLGTVLNTIVTRAVQLSGTTGGAVYDYDEATREFHLRVAYQIGDDLIESIRGAPIRLGEGALGVAAVTRVPTQVLDILDEREYGLARLRPILARLGYRSLLAVPLLREERIVGGLVVLRREPGAFAAPVVHLLQTFATQSVLAIENARLFREIEEKGRQLESASKHKSQFLANMSHELRTPLNAILGYTELILDRIYGEVGEEVREVLVRLEKSGRHLLALINDVLDLSKIEAGQLTLSLNDYSVKDIVQTVVTGMESLAADKKLTLRSNLPPELPLGRGDERRITQVFLNLIGNAIKFTDVGEITVRVTTSNGAFVVAVADTGPGIAPEDQEKIFQEFQQGDNSSTRKKGGTGLGLSIARHIVEMHGGRIWVESTPGKGSTFWFTLPVRVERHREAG
jgi:signal transduction histidine kinase